MHSPGSSLNTLWGWATEPRNALSGITLRRIHPSEFQWIRYAGTMKFYKRPLILAKMILQVMERATESVEAAKDFIGEVRLFLDSQRNGAA